MRATINFSLGNYAAAIKDAGNAYEIVGRGKDYDGKIIESK